MPTRRYLDDDIVRVYDRAHFLATGKKKLLATLFWGDDVRVAGQEGDFWHVLQLKRVWNDAAHRYEWLDGLIPADARFRPGPLLKVRFVDVGQGDAAIVETPAGHLILVDGGEEEHLRRYVSAAWSHVLRTKSLNVAAIVVTHGDADHFAGLTKLADATRPGRTGPIIDAARVYHNGLVKAPSSKDGHRRPEAEMFGASRKADGRTWATELEDDLRAVPDARMNGEFRKWKAALADMGTRSPGLEVRRLSYGDDAAFDFVDDDIAVEVLGPIPGEIAGKPALPFLHAEGSSSLSASHTINGHSIVLKMTYGNVRFLFGADLNAESENSLLERTRADGTSLAAEVLKVPHHGSADFSPGMLEAVRPVVSVVSSGDENAAKEYIHPRAGLVGALGKYSRATVEKPLIYVTEMVAFFERLGPRFVHEITDGGNESAASERVQNTYAKTTFGIVHVRTDGNRVLTVTHSGRDDRKESYAFTVDAVGAIEWEDDVRQV